MTTPTDHIIDLLRERGIKVDDIREELPIHPTKTYPRRALSEIKGVCLHHSAGRLYGREGAFSYARMHTADPPHGRGWPGVAYWAQVAPNGSLLVCHDLETASYAQGYRPRKGDENREFIGLLVQGFFRSPGYPSEDEPTADQVATAMVVWIVLRDTLDLPAGGLHGHFEFGKPACPGATLEALARAVQFRHAADRQVWENLDLARWKDRQLALAVLSSDLDIPAWDPGDADGVPGGRTLAALRAFQADNGLEPDGLWGPLTKDKVRRLLEGLDEYRGTE